MEHKDMVTKLEDHEVRIGAVEIEQRYNRKDIDKNNSALTKLVGVNNKIQLGAAVMLGSYLGWDKVSGMVLKLIGG